jgi:predicted nuclease of predicted toxin-antitoxin system
VSIVRIEVTRHFVIYAAGYGICLMRFLVDECTGSKVADWLRNIGHDVFSVYDESRGATDDEILTQAVEENWILVTNDKDFGELVFREGRAHRGVIFLRLDDEAAASKIAAMQLLLLNHADRLKDKFVVVTDSQVRFAEL